MSSEQPATKLAINGKFEFGNGDKKSTKTPPHFLTTSDISNPYLSPMSQLYPMETSILITGRTVSYAQPPEKSSERNKDSTDTPSMCLTTNHNFSTIHR